MPKTLDCTVTLPRPYLSLALRYWLVAARLGYWGDVTQLAVSSTTWSVRINSVAGGGRTVRLSELALMDGDTQLGQHVATPTISPGVTNGDSSPSLLNNGQTSGDVIACPLPCTVTYRFPKAVSPTALKIAPGR